MSDPMLKASRVLAVPSSANIGMIALCLLRLVLSRLTITTDASPQSTRCPEMAKEVQQHSPLPIPSTKHNVWNVGFSDKNRSPINNTSFHAAA
jgi:hypothetical protein